MFSWRSSWRYLISLMADISIPTVRVAPGDNAISELSNFDAFYCDSPVRPRLFTEIYNSILSFTDLLLFRITMFVARRRHLLTT
jgi:hypothetical protein